MTLVHFIYGIFPLLTVRRIFFILDVFVSYNCSASNFRIHLTKPKAINLTLSFNLSSFLTWHNSVQIRHLLNAVIYQLTVVLAQYLQDIRPQTLLNLRMKCKLVQDQTQSTTRRPVTA